MQTFNFPEFDLGAIQIHFWISQNPEKNCPSHFHEFFELARTGCVIHQNRCGIQNKRLEKYKQLKIRSQTNILISFALLPFRIKFRSPQGLSGCHRFATKLKTLRYDLVTVVLSPNEFTAQAKLKQVCAH